MERQTVWRWGLPLLMAGFLGLGVVQAVEPRPGPGMMGGYGPGPGMMGGGDGGYGPGMMGGYGMGPGMMGGYGMGPGMMGGYGMGPGMMGGYGMGPGMMGGQGMGPGMMGGQGMGPGMMGGQGMGLGPIWALELNENQRRAIDNIMAEQHKQHWAAMSAMIDAQGKLRELQMADRWDEKAIAGVYDDIFKQQRAMIESSVRTRNRIQDQLTAEQKEQLRSWSWRGRWGR